MLRKPGTAWRKKRRGRKKKLDRTKLWACLECFGSLVPPLATLRMDAVATNFQTMRAWSSLRANRSRAGPSPPRISLPGAGCACCDMRGMGDGVSLSTTAADWFRNGCRTLMSPLFKQERPLEGWCGRGRVGRRASRARISDVEMRKCQLFLRREGVAGIANDRSGLVSGAYRIGTVPV